MVVVVYEFEICFELKLPSSRWSSSSETPRCDLKLLHADDVQSLNSNDDIYHMDGI